VEDTVRCAWSTEDHKVAHPVERERISAAGLDSSTTSSCVLGNTTLNMSRSFGDFIFKQNNKLPIERQAVIAIPDISVFPRTPVDKFVVIACDGVYDVMSNAEIVTFFSQRLCALSSGRSWLGAAGSGWNNNYSSRSSSGRGSGSGSGGGSGSGRGGVDGLWDGDSFSADSNSDPSTVRQSAAAAACDELLQECLRRGSCDNMSVVVILF